MKDITLQQMQCALVVGQVGSISKAAKQLYLNQPNLSKAISTLEDELGYRIFQRSPKGITITPKGEIFLRYASEIVQKMELMEQQTQVDLENKIDFRISIPRATYLASIFTRYIDQIKDTERINITFIETNNTQVIDNISTKHFNLGVIRIPVSSVDRYAEQLVAKRLKYHQLARFRFQIVVSKEHPLADRETIHSADLADYFLVRFSDYNIPSSSTQQVNPKRKEPKRIISVTERGSMFNLLCHNPYTYSWLSPLPVVVKENLGLVQIPCEDFGEDFVDLLIHHEQYMFTQSGKDFLNFVYNLHKQIPGFIE